MTPSLPLTVVALLWLAAPGAALAASELVLVASSRSPVAQMSMAEARKLFLGMPLRAGNGQALKPIRNASDGLASEMFMQRIMFMSAEDYERQIQTRISRTGGSRPPAYEQAVELIGALQRDPFAVSYMPRGQARASSGLKIIGGP